MPLHNPRKNLNGHLIGRVSIKAHARASLHNIYYQNKTLYRVLRFVLAA